MEMWSESSDIPVIRTVAKDSEEFERYLKGTISSTHRAIPVETWSPNSTSETVTFHLVPIVDLHRPPLYLVLLKTLRARAISFTVFPLLSVLVLLVQRGAKVDWLLALGCIGSVFSLQMSAWLLNDYEDHMKGLDRVHPNSGSRTIQKGWLTAGQVQRLGVFFLVGGIGLGLPALWKQPLIVLSLGILALGCILFYSKAERGLRSNGLAEQAVFWMWGPFLVLGFTSVLGSPFRPEFLFLSLASGFHSSCVVFLSHFSRIFSNSLVGILSLPNRLGFDRSLNWGMIWVWLVPSVYFAFFWNLKIPIWAWLCFFPIEIYGGHQVFQTLRLCKSPLSSELTTLRSRAENWHLISQIALFLILLTSFLVSKNPFEAVR